MIGYGGLMRVPWNVSVLCRPRRDDAIVRDDDPIGAVQDHFGAAFVCLQSKQRAGDIHQARAVSTKRPPAMVRARIIRAVHVNTVRAMVRKTKCPERPLMKGFWYEVICD